MERIDIVNLFITHPTEKLFVAIKRSNKDSLYGDMYALPGGKVETSETIKMAAQRELMEETGLELEEIDLTPDIISPLIIKNRVFYIGVFNATVKNFEFKINDSDIKEVLFISGETLIDSLHQNNYNPDQVEILRRKLEQDGYIRHY